MSYGSLQNTLAANSNNPLPEVGMACTMLSYSDRHAATVIEVRRFKTGKRAGQVKECVVQEDHAKRIDSNGMSDAQEYRYERNTEGRVRTYRLTAAGRWVGVTGGGLYLGHRASYYDFSR